METVAVGTRWHLAAVPLPAAGPPVDRPSLGCEVGLEGLFLVDESRDPVASEVADRVGEARWLAAMSARYDQRLADTYLRGAAELAARSAAPTETRRREWGARGMLAELACALRLSETTLARRLTRITMLAAFPRLRDAAASGRVSGWHCDVVLDVFAGVTDAGILAAADEALAERASTATAPELRQAARRWRARHVPRTEEQRQAAVADRRVELTPADEDMVWLSALIPAAAGLAIDHRLSDIAAVAASDSGDARTAQQLRADAFVALPRARSRRQRRPVDGPLPDCRTT